MLNLKETLLDSGYFVDNEYLKSYCTLIERHHNTPVRRKLTNRHHIIPRALFKIKGETVDDNPTNLVNLPYREHTLAHYYLCLCTVDPLMYANELAFTYMLGRRQLNAMNKQLLCNLPMYESICRDVSSKRGKMKLYEQERE